MKINTTIGLGTLILTLAAPLYAGDEPGLPTTPAAPEAPATVPAPVPAPPRHRPGRKGEISGSVDLLAEETREFNAKTSGQAKLAAEHARLAALDTRSGLRGGDGNRTLVLPAGGDAPESLAESHEDLAVMSRILNKAVAKESRRGSMRFSFSMGDTGGNLDAMYLEGYGAVFLLNADFPLVAPPSPVAVKAPAKEEDATWERTKRELRGGERRVEEDAFGFGGGGGAGGGSWSSDDDQPKYEAEKVESLKRRLLGTFRHGKNLRALKENEHLTVIVFGKTTGKRTQVGQVVVADDEPARSEGGSSGTTVSQSLVGYVKTDSVRQSTLVLRAKKADILRLASGAISNEEFVRLVSVSAF